MTYLLQIYNTTAMEQFESLSDDEREAITGEYMAIAQAPGVTGGHAAAGAARRRRPCACRTAAR